MKRCIVAVAGLLMCLVMSTAAAEQSKKLPWHEWVKEVREEALGEGIRPEVFDEAFIGVKEPTSRVVSLDRSQPEKRLTFFTISQNSDRCLSHYLRGSIL